MPCTRSSQCAYGSSYCPPPPSPQVLSLCNCPESLACKCIDSLAVGMGLEDVYALLSLPCINEVPAWGRGLGHSAFLAVCILSPMSHISLVCSGGRDVIKQPHPSTACNTSSGP